MVGCERQHAERALLGRDHMAKNRSAIAADVARSPHWANSRKLREAPMRRCEHRIPWLPPGEIRQLPNLGFLTVYNCTHFQDLDVGSQGFANG